MRLTFAGSLINDPELLFLEQSPPPGWTVNARKIRTSSWT